MIHFDGHPHNVIRRLRPVIRRAHRAGLIVTATTDGTHAKASWHKILPGRNKLGHAVDFGLPAQLVGTDVGYSRLVRFQHAELRRAKRLRYRTYKEILGPDNAACVLAGRPCTLVEHSALEDQHDNHVHVAR